MTLLRIGAGGGGSDKDKEKSKEIALEKQRSKSLASYIDLEKKMKHEEEEKFKRVQRDREKMAEAEKKLKRAQERAAIELKRLQSLGAGKGVAVAGVSSSSSSSSSAKGKEGDYLAGMIILENLGKAGWLNVFLGIFNFAAGVSISGDIDTYTRVSLTKKQNLTYDEARAYTDSARSTCTGILVLGIFQFIFGCALIAFSTERYKDKISSIQDRTLLSQILFLVMFVFTVVPFAWFFVVVLFQTWYSDLDNKFSTAYLVTNGMVSLMVISWAAYHFSLWGGKRAAQSGAKAAAYTDAAKKAAAAMGRK
jgi:hypothetical protein